MYYEKEEILNRWKTKKDEGNKKNNKKKTKNQKTKKKFIL